MASRVEVHNLSDWDPELLADRGYSMEDGGGESKALNDYRV
jgi:hypothetical protein